MPQFTHLHVHTQFSLLDGASKVEDLIAKAKQNGMTALATTDHGNLYGAKIFHKEATKQGIKPIIGCEAYVSRRSHLEKSDNKIDRSGHHLIILAKNKIGYHNLLKLISHAHTAGQYYKPRIDKDLLRKYKEGLIVSSACLGGELAKTIRNNGIDAGEEVIREFVEIFGDDYYLEMMRHPTGNPRFDEDTLKQQDLVNQALLELSKRTGVKVIATNDSHFTNAEDAEAHDILVCLNTGKDRDDPARMRYTGQEYLKTPAEMAALFPDNPEALANTMEIVDKVEAYELDRDAIMPEFPLPEGFDTPDTYLRHITYEGAQRKFDKIDEVVTERLDFELETIKKMGFPGYFLIVWDFLKAARDMNVSVGPGRGSAAGSAVAYCLDITNIDPIKYDLLFERFLNPERVSMPDIDIDFDDDGREQVLNWVVQKYGKNRVANVITFGKMAPKMAIRDVARVLKLPLPDADRLAKLIPEKPGTNFKMAFEEVPELKELTKSGDALTRNTLEFAQTLEGTVRNTGVHACGIIISRDDLMEHIPIGVSKEAELYVTQYEGKHIEDVGMLKMDFLGLKTLSIIKDALENIEISKNFKVDIDNISLEDKKTFELFAKGETTAIFQFESDGMKKHMKALKPSRFEDLIAMNALYRPGPMEYIPQFIRRKHGKEPIHYDIPIMKEYLEDTYGITVYQEQVMLLSRSMAGFTRGQADSLRKAMGKKIISMMNELKIKFVDGCKKNNLPEDKVLKVWNDWEAFAKYAFNKSHSTCYSYVAYQTAYLKAHYPAEFMAAVLSRNLSDIKKITTFMDETKRMGLVVLGPDVNESFTRFTVNKEGAIRFGMAAIKGVGQAAVDAIIAERQENGPFKDIFDFVERIDLHTVGKRNIEGLAISGGFDSFPDIKRSQFFEDANGDGTFIESLIRYGNKFMEMQNGSQQSLFGGDVGDSTISRPPIPPAEEWPKLEQLNKEKNLIGMYLSAHPLDDYKLEIDNYCNASLSDFYNMEALKGRDLKIAGIVTDVQHKTTKGGKPFGSMTVEDYSDSYKITFFSKDYMDYKAFFTQGYSLLLEGRIQHRFNNPENELEFKPNKISLLPDVKDKMINSIDLKIKVSNLTDDLIEEIEGVAAQNKGSKTLKFLVYDPENTKIWVRMTSRKHRVTLTHSLLNYLKTSPDIEYKIF